MQANAYHNKQLGKEIADFVNTAMGQGPLKTHFPLPLKQNEISLEHSSKILGDILFASGLGASRIRMTNPNTYIMASPFVRKQYLKAAISAAAAWFLVTSLIKAGAGDEAQVGDDPLNADFGKVRMGIHVLMQEEDSFSSLSRIAD